MNQWQQRMGGINRFVMVIFSQSKLNLRGRFGWEKTGSELDFVWNEKKGGKFRQGAILRRTERWYQGRSATPYSGNMWSRNDICGSGTTWHVDPEMHVKNTPTSFVIF